MKITAKPVDSIGGIDYQTTIFKHFNSLGDCPHLGIFFIDPE
jgi:hypothetical protein